MSEDHAKHRVLTKEQSAHVHLALEEMTPIAFRVQNAVGHAYQIVDGQRELKTGKIVNPIYEICPYSAQQTVLAIRELTHLYEELAHSLDVEMPKAWEPGAKNK